MTALLYVCASEIMAVRLLAVFALSAGLTTALLFDGAGKQATNYTVYRTRSLGDDTLLRFSFASEGFISACELLATSQ